MDNTTNALSRRQLMAGTAVTLAAVATAARAHDPSSPGATAPMVDPSGKYPKPPFKTQSQPWPGLASRMEPRPDHGETSYRGTGRLTGRRALVTGGDSGIGRAAAIAFAREGADVAINYLPAEEPDAREVVELIQGAGRNAVAIAGDIRAEAFNARLIADANRRLGGLDILVINAARQQVHPDITRLSTDEFDWTMKTNIYAMFWQARAAVPLMKPGSSIIITTSEQADDPSGELFDYAMTKAAGKNLAESLAKQLAPRGIRVNGVAPGPFWTPLQVSGGATQDKLVNFGGNTALGRPGQPAEIAGLFVRLAENDGSYTTGAIFDAKGGGKVK